MSIPVSMDPLGTLGGGLRPFVQPVMITESTWDESKPYSFGMTLEASSSGGWASRGPAAPFNADDTDSWPSWNTTAEWVDVILQGDVNLESVEITTGEMMAGDFNVMLRMEVGGEYVDISEGMKLPTSGTVTVPLLDITRTRKIRVYFSRLSVGILWVKKIQLNGTI